MKRNSRFGQSGMPSGQGSKLETWLHASDEAAGRGNVLHASRPEPVEAAEDRPGEDGRSTL